MINIIIITFCICIFGYICYYRGVSSGYHRMFNVTYLVYGYHQTPIEFCAHFNRLASDALEKYEKETSKMN